MVGWSVAQFYRLESTGGPVPSGPVLVVANHPNSLVDPLIIFRTAGRPTRPLAKAPLFEHPLVGPILRSLGGLPVYRRQDDDSQMHRNEDSFRKAIDALRAGDAVQIYPEGISHSSPSLTTLRTGAARIALAAEAESGWTLELRVAPIGITYRAKAVFRTRALAMIGEPFAVAPFRAAYEADPQEAARVLTAEIGKQLERLILNLARAEDGELIETAERIWTRMKGLAGWRERDGMSERLVRMQAFATGLAWLRLHDPQRLTRLEGEVRRYRWTAARMGAHEADVPPRYPVLSVLRYVLREGFLLVVGAPLAALGTVIWTPAYLAPRWTVARIRPEPEAVATYKLATSFFAVPLTIMALAGASLLLWGRWAGLAALVVVPALALLALGWRERWGRVREDARLFVNVLVHPRARGRLDQKRAQLVDEFDEVAKLAGVGKSV
jgi:1-acyl-sn-glycerol-3-phosphate acyltransferase